MSLFEAVAPAGTAFFGFQDPGYILLFFDPYIFLNHSLILVLSLKLLYSHLVEIILNPYQLLVLEVQGLPLNAAPGFLVQIGKADPGWC